MTPDPATVRAIVDWLDAQAMNDGPVPPKIWRSLPRSIWWSATHPFQFYQEYGRFMALRNTAREIEALTPFKEMNDED
jgi:hypothetical protein